MSLREPHDTWSEHAAAAGTHDAILTALTALRGSLSSMRVLDIPCGAGAFSRRLFAAGCDVHAMDLVRNDPLVIPHERLTIADANRGLPFKEESFDAVVSIEGIEHLDNPTGFLRECARVVRDGGHVVVSTPNADSIRSRYSVLSRGYHEYFRPASSNQKRWGHQLAIDQVFFRGAAKRAGLDVLSVSTNRLRGKSWITEQLRGLLTRKLPDELQTEICFYGEVMIYGLVRVRRAS